MKAVTISRFGGPEVMEYSEIPPPALKAGEALVELEFAGVNFTDVYQRSGFYARSHTYQTPLPMTVGWAHARQASAAGATLTRRS